MLEDLNNGRRRPRRRLRRFAPITALLGALALACAAIAGCGSSSSDPSGSSAQSLLKQTFSGSHQVNSGVIDLSLEIVPKGSSVISGPISLSFGGPFQSRGTGKLPASDFTIAISALKEHGSLALISTGTKGYVSLSGDSYQLPQKSFTKLESSFAAAESSASGSSSTTGKASLKSLGIDPLSWLSDPAVVGQQNIGGAQTTEIRAKVNVRALLADIDKLSSDSAAGKSSSGSLSSRLSASTESKIVKELGSPTFDVWTGNSDKTLRRMTLSFDLPVSGSLSSSLGGLKSASVALTLQFNDLNQPQTITAPTKLEPYDVFQAKVESLLEEIEGGLGSGLTGSSSSSSSSSSAAAAGSDKKYSDCITKADGNVAKMQKCTSLLGTG